MPDSSSLVRRRDVQGGGAGLNMSGLAEYIGGAETNSDGGSKRKQHSHAASACGCTVGHDTLVREGNVVEVLV